MRDNSISKLIEFLLSVEEDKMLPLCEILKIEKADIELALIDEATEEGYLDEDEDIEDIKSSDRKINKLKKLEGGKLYRFAIAKTIYAGLQWRASKITERYPSYKEILILTAKNMGLSTTGPVKQLEIRISKEAFSQFVNNLSDEEKEELETDLRNRIKDMEVKGFGHLEKRLTSEGVIATLTGAPSSAFVVFFTAITTLFAISSVIRITLPFVAYTALTRAISIATGPIGWMIGGLFTVWTLWKPNFKVLIPAILYITALKSEKELMEEKEPKKKLKVKKPIRKIKKGGKK